MQFLGRTAGLKNGRAFEQDITARQVGGLVVRPDVISTNSRQSRDRSYPAG